MRRHLLPTLLAAGMLVAGVSRAEFFEEKISPDELTVVRGLGAVRLDGMGLRLASIDENTEPNLLDLGDNPAGLLFDRDAWSVDVRWTHQERNEESPRSRGFDYNGNTYSAFGAVRSQGNLGFAGGIDYLDGRVGDRATPVTGFKQTRLRFLYNQVFGRLRSGLEFRYATESEEVRNSSDPYLIEHDTGSYTGVLGFSFQAHEYLTVAVRGDLQRSMIDGVAATDAHEDQFDWKRPSGSFEGQVFAEHPRVRGGVVLGRREGAGEENMVAAWSPLFFFNPTNQFIRFESRTLTEQQSQDYFRTRWDVDLVPGRAGLAAVLNRSDRDYESRTDPSVIGSRPARELTLEQTEFGLGGRTFFLGERLMAGAELFRTGSTLTDFDPLAGYEEETTSTTVSAGVEFLLLEQLALRGGWGTRSIKYDDRNPTEGSAPEYVARPQGSFNETTASFGFGLIPRGGILQIDAAITLGLSSDLEVDQNRASLNARLLF